MKKLSYIIMAVAALFMGACSDTALDTAPTSKVPDFQIFADAQSAQAALNGIYRGFFVSEWSDGWGAENPGIMTTTLIKDLHGEDHVMSGQGNGWLWYDYRFMVDSDYTGVAGRQYSMWNMYYAIITQTNMIISNENHLVSFGSQGHHIMGQAYALRAFCYLSLYEWFCQGDYSVNKGTAGVPIYTEPTKITTEGKARGTVEQLFAQINTDFEKSVQHYESSEYVDGNKTHVSPYTAYGMYARAALIQENWDKVTELTTKALSSPTLVRVAPIGQLSPINKVTAPSVMWGFEVIADQTGPYGSFLSHMDPEGGYGKGARQCIDAWLWHQIPDTDYRKTAWWEGSDKGSAKYMPYCQIKFRLADMTTSTGDVQYMRTEEMVLMAAEAACRKGDYAKTRELLAELGEQRDSKYAERLARFADSASYNEDTHGDFTTLMDEILFQRRIELWCEGYGRAFDLRRLNLGYSRDYDGTNHPDNTTMDAGAYEFTTLLPQKEFDTNNQIDQSEQNPR